MGSWFSNLHVRKNSAITETAIVECICKIMTAQHFLPVESKDEADGAFAIISDTQSQWYCVYSDLFSFGEPQQFAAYATPMSEDMKTDILGVSCFDSDYLFLNLINTADQTDAWAGVGSAAGLGIRRRTNLTAWRNKICDFDAFKKRIKKEYVFAEDVLADIENCIHLPEKYGTASYEYLADLGLGERATYLYFKLPEEMKTKEPVQLAHVMYNAMPCFLNKSGIISGINIGEESRGLSVFFVGPYVEHEEITFSDVCFVKRKKNDFPEVIPIELEKVQLSDGQWAYYYHDPGFRIPPKIDDRLPLAKRQRVVFERSIVVRFVPHGNARKILDITVILQPDKNPQGQIVWNAWHPWGSKKAFIEQYNAVWDKHRDWSPNPNTCPPHLREEDFD